MSFICLVQKKLWSRLKRTQCLKGELDENTLLAHVDFLLFESIIYLHIQKHKINKASMRVRVFDSKCLTTGSSEEKSPDL